ncbi:MAG: NAD(P)-dependent oxidoreductase [Rhodospirillaceae bacterium]|jgi:3-hydroxyisobutyrate dehydrogenase-like beta-hydroxyacid dehydrogenase|nr:NAD(P)-dependent oxidoreductase [Rhodospirillales bacterium]MBT3907077.1 NAD(P)-dependent oxidoreductase [Rhodospirillaceae bacterium]MBT4701769.1 NAD(P)-dependent oxidoreductase [Rhodospirillaceae bacterium]MBT5034125.1 NAD(P)-dependent oxidoreductase [Rhodospirillaceae bacterium]MBT6222042.1 NAD(P)-dependent oxidoreductase [Rhodospirillaceae bacterium]
MTKTVGFIGLGVLGSAMAPNIIKSGFEVTGFDVRAEAMADMEAVGMKPGASPKDVAEKVDVVVTCLPSLEVLHNVFGGEDGIDKAYKPGQIVIETSTFPVAEKEKARDTLAAVGKVTLDCPVSGNRILAVKKQLTAFGSGDEAAYRSVEDVVGGFAHRKFYIGDFGSGMKMKFCGNILNLVHNSVAAEVMVLGMKSGLDPKVIHEAISGSGSSSSMFEVRGEMMVRNNYDHEGMSFMTPVKDSRFISDHAANLCVPIPIYQAALAPYYAAVAQGHFDEDAAAVCAAMELAANCVRPKEDD